MLSAQISLSVVAALYSVAIGLSLAKRHYAYAIFFLLVALYELTGMSIRVWNEQLTFLVPAMRLYTYGSEINSRELTIHAAHLMVLLAVATSLYVLLAGRQRSSPIAPSTHKSVSTAYWHFAAALLALGVISLASGAGAARRADYQSWSDGFGAEVTGLHAALFHGRNLLVVAIPILIWHFSRRRWASMFLVLIALMPIVHQLIIAGRRQVFLPSVMYLLLYMLYSSARYKALTTGLLATAFVVGSGLMFSGRGDFYQEAYGLEGLAAVYRPFFGELMATSTISLVAEQDVRAEDLSYGTHFVRTFLDSLIPYIKIGEIYSEATGTLDWNFEFTRIAPRGALSMLADAYLAVGPLNSLLLGLMVGPCLWWMHHAFTRARARAAKQPNHSTIWATCVAASLIVSYRSGIVDAISMALKFSVLYWTVIGFTLLIWGNPMRVSRNIRSA